MEGLQKEEPLEPSHSLRPLMEIREEPLAIGRNMDPEQFIAAVRAEDIPAAEIDVSDERQQFTPYAEFEGRRIATPHDSFHVEESPSKRSEMIGSAALAEAIEAGARKGRERTTELTPQSLDDLRRAARAELRNAQGFALLVYPHKAGQTEAQQQAYRIGMRSVVSAWYREQKPVMQIASGLGEYAALQAPLPYVNAEAAIAQNFLAQLTSGRKTIDLSQRYATDDQSAAQARHEKALENLRPLMRETSRLHGYKVLRGAAIADGLTQREVLALRHEQKQAPGNL